MDFKVSYLDAGLTNSYFSDSDQLVGSSVSHTSPSNSSTLSSGTPQRLNRRYKTQLRDFLSTCRTKRKLATHSSPVPAPVPGVGVDYCDTSTAAAVAAAYNMYSTPYPTENVYPGNYHQGLYDNRFLTTTDNLFHQYRPLYTEYHHATPPYVANGFLDISPRSSLPTYETASVHHQLAKSSDCDKLYGCHQPVEQKYSPVIDNRSYITGKCSEYAPVVTVPLCDLQQSHKVKSAKTVDSVSPVVSSPSATINGLVTPKLEDIKSDMSMLHYGGSGEAVRQTVLMWGSGGGPTPTPSSPASPYLQDKKFLPVDPLKSLAEMNSMSESKWKPETPPSPKSYYQGQQSTYEGGSSEVWPSHHQYYPYHHHQWVLHTFFVHSSYLTPLWP